MKQEDTDLTVYTIGHSTRPIKEFIDILKSQAITQLVDIRTVPKSRHNPQYWHDELARSLEQAGIGYTYLAALGGLRPKAKHSLNTAWRNQSFRNYADYMQTPEFQDGLTQLCELAHSKTSAIMCAEAVPWRCHRSLVGDALSVRGVNVIDIITPKSIKPHTVTSFAVVDGTTVTYPGEDTPDEKSKP